jgi:DNA-binding transcriptional LysR family regulator
MYNQNIELRHLRYFVAVAEERHFSRAAEKLHMAQPPLSQQIRQLEDMVGVRLFERNHHSVMLTSAGQLFLEDAGRILELVDQTLLRMQQAQHGQVGRLAIGFVNNAVASETFLPDVLAVYHQRFPAVEVRLCEMHPEAQLQALQKQQIQMGFVASFQRIPAEFEAEVLQRIPFVVVLAPQHRFASQSCVALRSLIKENFILCPRQASPVLYDRIIQRYGECPHVTQEVSDIRIVLGLVAANLGVSLVPASAMPLRTEGVIYRPLSDDGGAITIETALVWHRKSFSPVVEGFLAVAREVLAHHEHNQETPACPAI